MNEVKSGRALDRQPLRRHDEIAERIIRMEGLTFALAVQVCKGPELAEARTYLKAAICRALADELEHGARLQRGVSEDNALMDSIEASEKDAAR